jgi:hypothetical protein
MTVHMPHNNNRNSAKASQRGEQLKIHEPASQVSEEAGSRSETYGAALRESLLLKQYEEINRYIRSTCQLTMAWYTFFITGNLIASGWLFSEGVKGDRMPPLYVGIVSGLFIVINVLSTIGFSELIPHLKETDQQLVAILKKLRCPPIKKKADKKAKLVPPCPHELYIKLLKYYRLSLLAVTAFWVLLLYLKLSASILAPR